MAGIKYPSVARIIEFNAMAITFIHAKKADRAKVLSKSKLMIVIDDCEENDGDVYDKAVVLLKGLIQKHPFASGNGRTALIATVDFLLSNKKQCGIKDNPNHASVMQGIREKHYSDEEIKEWIKNGKIRTFKR